MIIFAPQAYDPRETRTPLTPSSAQKLIGLGATVQAEMGHGVASGYADEAYTAVGVTLIPRDQAPHAAAHADVVLGVSQPTADHLTQMKQGAWFIGRLDPFRAPELVTAAVQAQIKLVSMELLPRTTLAQKMDVLSSQANLAGYYAVILAAEHSHKILPMMMTPAGTIPPAKVFVIGVGVAGLQAIATAKRLGARVQAFDTRPVVAEQVASLGAKFVQIDLGDVGQTAQGYAQALTAEQLARQQAGMAKVCAESDIVITTAKLFGRPAPILLTHEMVAQMRPGSIIVDLAAETGGNVEGTIPDQETTTPNGVRIIGYRKLETRLPTHASQVYAANLANFIEHFWDATAQVLQPNLHDEIMASCLLTLDGQGCTNNL